MMFMWLRDRLRGYRDADLASALLKLKVTSKPGEIVYLSKQEWRAYSAYLSKGLPLSPHHGEGS